MHLTAPPVFHPASSPLGKLVRRWIDDERRAESVYIVVAALLLVVASLAGQWGWVLWGTENGDPHLGYFAAQLVGGGLAAGYCLLGWRRPIQVWAGPDRLEIQRGPDTLSISYIGIQSTERIPATVYHSHWRRYARTRSFVNRLSDEVLLLRTDQGPVVLCLAEADLVRLAAHLDERLEPAHGRRLVRAA